VCFLFVGVSCFWRVYGTAIHRAQDERKKSEAGVAAKKAAAAAKQQRQKAASVRANAGEIVIKKSAVSATALEIDPALLQESSLPDGWRFCGML
jgi:hypothetical protein